MMNELMNSSNHFFSIQFIRYKRACFDVRDKLLPKQRSFCNTVLVSSCKYELVVVVVVVGAKAKSFLSDARQPEKCPFLSLNLCFLLIK